MKIQVQALVVRDKRDNSIISVNPIGDMYDEVTVAYWSKYVTPEELRTYVEGWMGVGSKKAIEAEATLEKENVWYDSQEAKDFNSVGNLLIGIESKDVEW
jgi:hypothetical protein